MNRSGVAAKLSSVWQPRACTVTPLPVVTMPTMRSPGSGWQHPAYCTAMPGSRPLTARLPPGRLGAREASGGIIRGARADWRSSG